MKRIIIGLLLLTGLSGCHIYRTYERPESSGQRARAHIWAARLPPSRQQAAQAVPTVPSPLRRGLMY